MSVLDVYNSLAEVLAKLDPKKILEIQASMKLSEEIETLVIKKRKGKFRKKRRLS